VAAYACVSGLKTLKQQLNNGQAQAPPVSLKEVRQWLWAMIEARVHSYSPGRRYCLQTPETLRMRRDGEAVHVTFHELTLAKTPGAAKGALRTILNRRFRQRPGVCSGPHNGRYVPSL
jgi:hypothetical protein